VSTKPAPESSYAMLWEGENPAFHDALLQELEQSGIPYADKPIGEDEIEPDPLPIDWRPRFGFEVAVHQADLPRAKEILEKLLSEGELADVELPAKTKHKTMEVRRFHPNFARPAKNRPAYRFGPETILGQLSSSPLLYGRMRFQLAR
jgi:hypothetical protein